MSGELPDTEQDETKDALELEKLRAEIAEAQANAAKAIADTATANADRMKSESEMLQNTAKNGLELEKLAADIDKTKREAVDIRRWALRPAFLQVVGAFLIAFATGFYGFWSGWFNDKQQSLSVKTELLTLQQHDAEHRPLPS